MLRKAIARYNAPTPIKYRAWGKFILIIGTTLGATLQGLEVNKYITIAVSFATAIGAALPELAVIHEPPSEASTHQEP